jgi:protein-S-isoprenylcysteine O-methyltransferase Ste14
VAAWLPAAVETARVIYHYGNIPQEARTWLARILAQFGTPGRSGYTSNLSFALIAGAVIAVYGSYFRSSAYRALGRHFTFHLALKTDHTLIREWPYSVVRHPSYTGFYLVALGYLTTTLAPDSWIRNIAWSQLIKRPGGWLTGLVLARTAVHYALILKVFYDRTSEEDALLKRKFGKQWDTWAEEVPYMLMPGVY